MTALTSNNIVLVPIRSGVGLRLGANVGYLKFTPEGDLEPALSLRASKSRSDTAISRTFRLNPGILEAVARAVAWFAAFGIIPGRRPLSMIEPIMFFGIGFLAASLFGLMLIPLVHNRAVRLTMRRLEAATPLSMAEIQADKDQLRAEFAMSTRRLEISSTR